MFFTISFSVLSFAYILLDPSDLLKLLRKVTVHNPDRYCEYCHTKAVTGYSFRKDFWLSDVKPDLLPQDILDAVYSH